VAVVTIKVHHPHDGCAVGTSGHSKGNPDNPDTGLPEPAATQEAISSAFAGMSSKRAERRSRKGDIQDLKRVPGKEARQFRRENPDADIHDWERYQKQGGRWQGKETADSADAATNDTQETP
jgi:hypothetical protein